MEENLSILAGRESEMLRREGLSIRDAAWAGLAVILLIVLATQQVRIGALSARISEIERTTMVVPANLDEIMLRAAQEAVDEVFGDETE